MNSQGIIKAWIRERIQINLKGLKQLHKIQKSKQ